MPDLIGLAVPAAHDAALEAGLLAVVIAGDRPNYAVRDRPNYQVIGQDPGPGRCLPRGHRIGVRVRYRPTHGPDAGRGGNGGGLPPPPDHGP